MPSFYMNTTEEFTVELWFQPACQFTNRSRGQVLFRTTDVATLFSPQVSLEGGEVVLKALLADPVIPNQYFSDMVTLTLPPLPGAGGWRTGEWHHVAFSVNSTHAAAYRNGSLVASLEVPDLVSGSGTRVLGLPTDSPQSISRARLGVQGAGMGLGLNGAIKRVAIYGTSLRPERIMSHYRAAAWGRAAPPPLPSSADAMCVGPDGAKGWCPGLGGAPGMLFYACRASEVPEEKVQGGTSRILSGVCGLAAFFSLLIALFVHMEWCDQTASFTAPESLLTIHEQLPVDASRANYPLIMLASISILLPAAYLSVPLHYAVLDAADGRPVYVLPYLLWSISEACGVILLIAASHRVGHSCGLFLAFLSACTPLLALASQLLPTTGHHHSFPRACLTFAIYSEVLRHPLPLLCLQFPSLPFLPLFFLLSSPPLLRLLSPPSPRRASKQAPPLKGTSIPPPNHATTERLNPQTSNPLPQPPDVNPTAPAPPISDFKPTTPIPPVSGWCPPNDTTVERSFEHASCFTREELPLGVILLLTLVPAFTFLRPLRGIGSVQTRLAPCSPSAELFRPIPTSSQRAISRDEVSSLIRDSGSDAGGGRRGLIRVLKRAREYLGGDAGAERDRRASVVGLLMGWFCG